MNTTQRPKGGGTLVTPTGVEEISRHRREGLDELRHQDLRRRRAMSWARNEIGTVYMLLGGADFEYKDAKKKTRDNRIGNYFTVGDIGELNDEGYLFLRDRKTRHDHFGRCQHLPGGDRGRVDSAPEGRGRRSLRDPQRRLGRRDQGCHRGHREA